MKKLLILLLAAVMLLALLAGCVKIPAEDIANAITDYVIDKIEENASQNDGQTPDAEPQTPENDASQTQVPVDSDGKDDIPDEDGKYYSVEDVALYIHTYGKLPVNYITKNKAESLGWTGGSIEKYAPGCCIGGGRFGNYEKQLPDASGRKWTECDIDTLGKSSRGAKRIVFSNDGLIYYTDDHYESFTLLYGEE